jgi:hypothetical protein
MKGAPSRLARCTSQRPFAEHPHDSSGLKNPNKFNVEGPEDRRSASKRDAQRPCREPVKIAIAIRHFKRFRV